MDMKNLGHTDIKVSALGFGCWAIGGPFTMDGVPDGWGKADDKESVRAIERALELGIQFFDTSDAYGTGHSEKVLGRALKGRRQDAVIATKFGYMFDSSSRNLYSNYDVSDHYVRWACEQSMRRLGTDYIDLYQIHVGVLTWDELASVVDTLERMVTDGWIRAFGWSSEDREKLEVFAEQSSGAAIQHPLNVLNSGNLDLVRLSEKHRLTSIANGPLAMGLLSGRFEPSSMLPPDDVRGSTHEWVRYFKNGRPSETHLRALRSIRDILTADGRSLVQGALGWIWGVSDAVVPIPGLRTVKQVEEAAMAIEYGPLKPEQMQEIDHILQQHYLELTV